MSLIQPYGELYSPYCNPRYRFLVPPDIPSFLLPILSRKDDRPPSPKKRQCVEETVERKKHRPYSWNGEERLHIHFLPCDKSQEIRPTQRLGNKPVLIPDGLSGIFCLYDERWKFHIEYTNHIVIPEDKEEDNIVCIRWTMTHVKTNKSVSITETPAEARKRQIRGLSVCNKVMLMAMEAVACEYEAMAEKDNMLLHHMINHRARAKSLRPRRYSEGPLLFGLRHQCVQKRYHVVST
jgi:hypothetical protein